MRLALQQAQALLMALLIVGTYLESRCMCGFGQIWDHSDRAVDTQERHEMNCEAVAKWYRTHFGHPRWEAIPTITVYGAHRDELILHTIPSWDVVDG